MADPNKNQQDIAILQNRAAALEREFNEANQKNQIEVIYLDPEDSSVQGKLKARGQAVLLCDVSELAFTITLPQVSEFQGKILSVKKNNDSTNSLTVSPTPGDTIDQSSSDQVLSAATLPFLNLVPDRVNDNWAIIGSI